MSDSYYRFFPGDYLRDTGDLTLTEHGAYHILLDHYYMMESLTGDRGRLYRICRVITDEDKMAVEFVIKRYFNENGNGNLVNRKAEEEIANRRAFIAEQSRKGKISAEKRWPKDNRGYNHGSTELVTELVTELQPDCNQPSPSPSPLPKPNKKHIVCVLPEFLSQETWELFLSHRKAMKAPVVKGGESAFIKKFEKWKEEGWEPKAVVEMMIEKGWRSFKPEWIKEGAIDGTEEFLRRHEQDGKILGKETSDK